MNGQINNNIEPQINNNNPQDPIMNVPNSLPTEPIIKNNNDTFINNNQVINGINQTSNNETTIVNNPFQSTGINSLNQENMITNNNIQTNTSINNNDLNQEIFNPEQNNRFLTNNNTPNETTLNDLNVNGQYNNMDRPDYLQDPKVQENLGKTKKNTVTITPELKTVIIIALVLLVFIVVMPYIFDLIRNISY